LDKRTQDKIIYNALLDAYQKNLGSIQMFQYSKNSFINIFQTALNQSDSGNVKLKIKSYIERGWISCGKTGYIINPRLFER